MSIVFGTAGVPLTCPKRDSLEGIKFASQLGLGAFELEFVHSARMSGETARACGKAAREAGVILSAHAPYYINLCSEEKEKVEASKRRILDTLEIMQHAGGGRVVIHSGFYGRAGEKKAFELVKAAYLDLLDSMKSGKIALPVLAPETTGRPSAFGSLEELYQLASETGFSSFKPTIDFGHLHARANGGIKSKKDYEAVIDVVENYAGKRGTKELHCHFTGIRFSEKGERNHLEISSNSPRFDWLAEVLWERKCSGVIISESPNVEKDALEMKETYDSIAMRG